MKTTEHKGSSHHSTFYSKQIKERHEEKPVSESSATFYIHQNRTTTFIYCSIMCFYWCHPFPVWPVIPLPVVVSTFYKYLFELTTTCHQPLLNLLVVGHTWQHITVLSCPNKINQVEELGPHVKPHWWLCIKIRLKVLWYKLGLRFAIVIILSNMSLFRVALLLYSCCCSLLSVLFGPNSERGRCETNMTWHSVQWQMEAAWKWSSMSIWHLITEWWWWWLVGGGSVLFKV